MIKIYNYQNMRERERERERERTNPNSKENQKPQESTITKQVLADETRQREKTYWVVPMPAGGRHFPMMLGWCETQLAQQRWLRTMAGGIGDGEGRGMERENPQR